MNTPPVDSAAPNPMIEQLKSQIADIVEPAAVSWWPLAWGWWVLAAVVLVLLIVAAGWQIKRYWRNAYRRQALKTLNHITAKQASTDPHLYGQSLMAFSKQVALSAYPNQRATIAPLTGEAWLEWLNHTTKTPLFDDAIAEQWQLALYQAPQTNIDDQATQNEANHAMAPLTRLISRWIKEHSLELKDGRELKSSLEPSNSPEPDNSLERNISLEPNNSPEPNTSSESIKTTATTDWKSLPNASLGDNKHV